MILKNQNNDTCLSDHPLDGWTEIDQAELAAILESRRYVAPPPTAAQQLAALDAANTLTQRNLREFILLATEALKLGQAIDLSVLPGVAKVAEVEAAAAVLRAQL